jgi:hypothetical protein
MCRETGGQLPWLVVFETAVGAAAVGDDKEVPVVLVVAIALAVIASEALPVVCAPDMEAANPAAASTPTMPVTTRTRTARRCRARRRTPAGFVRSMVQCWHRDLKGTLDGAWFLPGSPRRRVTGNRQRHGPATWVSFQVCQVVGEMTANRG